MLYLLHPKLFEAVSAHTYVCLYPQNSFLKNRLLHTRLLLAPRKSLYEGVRCRYSLTFLEGKFSATEIPRFYALPCMSIRPTLQAVARPSAGSSDLAGAEGKSTREEGL